MVDPICSKPVNKQDLNRVPLTDVPKIIAAYNNSGEDKNKEGEGQSGADATKSSQNGGE